MVESQEFLVSVINKNVSTIINRESILQKMMNILRVNQAHAIYMQEGRHLDALVIYEQLVNESVQKGASSMGLLSCEPIVLANLCVVYIISKQNLKAEQLIQQIEKQQRES